MGSAVSGRTNGPMWISPDMSLLFTERVQMRYSRVMREELLHHKVLQVLLVFKAHIVDQVGVELEVLLQRDGPGLGVGLRIVDGQLDFEVPVIDAANALGDLGGVGDRIAVGVEPDAIPEARRVD